MFKSSFDFLKINTKHWFCHTVRHSGGSKFKSLSLIATYYTLLLKWRYVKTKLFPIFFIHQSQKEKIDSTLWLIFFPNNFCHKQSQACLVLRTHFDLVLQQHKSKSSGWMVVALNNCALNTCRLNRCKSKNTKQYQSKIAWHTNCKI
jgi:hypothetical protein